MKKLIAMLLAVVMVLGLCACSVETVEETKAAPAETQAAAEAPAATEAAAPAAATELDLWVYPVGGWGDQAKVTELMDAFKAATGISVKVEYLTYGDGDDKVNTAIEGNAAPDLIMEGPERLVANWGAKGKMVNIADLFDETDKAEIYPGPLAACFADENTAYEYPMCMVAHCMAINKTVFEAADAMQYIDEETRTWTTENFWKAMDAVYAYTNKTVGVVFCGGHGGDQGNRALINNLYGGTFTNPEHTEYTWTDENNVKALEALRDHPAIAFDPAIVGADEIALFYNGTLNMATCWNAAQQVNPNSANTGAGKTMNGDEIMYLAFPSENGTDAQLCGGIWGFGIFDNGDPAKIEAAKTFIKYFCDSEATIDAVRASTFFAARSAAEGTDMSAVWENDAVLTEYAMMLPMMGDYYNVAPNWTEARTAWWNMLQQVGAGEDIPAMLEQYQNQAIGK